MRVAKEFSSLANRQLPHRVGSKEMPLVVAPGTIPQRCIAEVPGVQVRRRLHIVRIDVIYDEIHTLYPPLESNLQSIVMRVAGRVVALRDAVEEWIWPRQLPRRNRRRSA